MSAEKIIQKIEQDAAQEADVIRAGAQEKAAASREAILAAARAKAVAIAEAAKDASEEALRRQLLIAGLEARKNTLSAKRAVLDEAFSMALDQLYNLDLGSWKALIVRIVAESSDTGDEMLRVPAADLTRYTPEFIAELNAALVKRGKKGELTLDPSPAPFRGGVQLIGSKSDVNGSFEALIREARDRYEREVSTLLFEAEVG